MESCRLGNAGVPSAESREWAKRQYPSQTYDGEYTVKICDETRNFQQTRRLGYFRAASSAGIPAKAYA